MIYDWWIFFARVLEERFINDVNFEKSCFFFLVFFILVFLFLFFFILVFLFLFFYSCFFILVFLFLFFYSCFFFILVFLFLFFYSCFFYSRFFILVSLFLFLFLFSLTIIIQKVPEKSPEDFFFGCFLRYESRSGKGILLSG